MTDRDLTTDTGLASALRPAVLRLARRLRQTRDESFELTSNQLSAMSVLLVHGDQTMGDLASLELVQPPSMTRIVNGLEERGFVARGSAQDKRRCVVALTDEGKQILLANRRRRDAWLACRLAELDSEEREVLRRAAAILEKVNHA